MANQPHTCASCVPFCGGGMACFGVDAATPPSTPATARTDATQRPIRRIDQSPSQATTLTAPLVMPPARVDKARCNTAHPAGRETADNERQELQASLAIREQLAQPHRGQPAPKKKGAS